MYVALKPHNVEEKNERRGTVDIILCIFHGKSLFFLPLLPRVGSYMTFSSLFHINVLELLFGLIP